MLLFIACETQMPSANALRIPKTYYISSIENQDTPLDTELPPKLKDGSLDKLNKFQYFKILISSII